MAAYTYAVSTQRYDSVRQGHGHIVNSLHQTGQVHTPQSCCGALYHTTQLRIAVQHAPVHRKSEWRRHKPQCPCGRHHAPPLPHPAQTGCHPQLPTLHPGRPGAHPKGWGTGVSEWCQALHSGPPTDQLQPIGGAELEQATLPYHPQTHTQPPQARQPPRPTSPPPPNTHIHKSRNLLARVPPAEPQCGRLPPTPPPQTHRRGRCHCVWIVGPDWRARRRGRRGLRASLTCLARLMGGRTPHCRASAPGGSRQGPHAP
jgi:hypothetical protein